jgi:hypothetical protein
VRCRKENRGGSHNRENRVRHVVEHRADKDVRYLLSSEEHRQKS